MRGTRHILAGARSLAGRRAVRIAVGAALMAAVAALALRGLDVSALRRAHVAWEWVVLSIVLNFASVALKAVVWKAALDAVPGEPPARYREVIPALLVGFLLNTVLFARLGEGARVAVLARRRSLSGRALATGTIAGTLVAEHIVLAAAFAVTAGGLALSFGVPGALRGPLLGALAVCAILVPAAVYLVRTRRRRRSRLLDELRAGQALLAQPGPAARAVAFGVLSWAAQIAGIWTALEAFGIELSAAAAGVVFVASTIAQLVPLWPGNVGVFQLGVGAPLVHLYAVSASTAVSFGIGLQVIEAAIGVGLGLVFLAREGLDVAGVRGLVRGGAEPLGVAA